MGEAEFRAWVAARRDRLRRTAYLLCGDWYLADDLVQDTLGRLYEVWSRVCATGDPDAYARRILVHRYVDHRRRPARREEPYADPPDSPYEVEPAVLRHREVLRAALADVPPGQRAVLVLRYWEDLSVEQTAAALSTSPGNVKSQASRGLATLRAALAARGQTDLLRDTSDTEEPA